MLNTFAQFVQFVEDLFKPLLCFSLAILQQTFHILIGITLKGTGGILLHGSGQVTEQLLIVHDISEVLILAIQTVDTADCLEQAMIVHGLVNIQICAGWCIEASQKLINHNQQLHVIRLFDEFLLCCLLKFFNPLCNTTLIRSGIRIDTNHFQIDAVFFVCIRFLVITDSFRTEISNTGFIRGNDCTLAEILLLEQFIILASSQNIIRHQNGIATTVRKTGLGFKIENDVTDNFLQTGAGTIHRLHIAPNLFQPCLGSGHQSPSLGFKPGIDPILGHDFLGDIPVFIPQIQNHTVCNTFIELIAVDISAKHLNAGSLVRFQQRCAGEAHKDGIGHNGLHGQMQFAGLGAVALIHKYENIVLCTEVGGQRGLQLFNIPVIVLCCSFSAALAELMHQRTKQPILMGVQPGQQIGATLGTDNGFIDTLVIPLNLLIQLITIRGDQHTSGGDIGQQPLGQPDHGQGFTAALGMPDDATLAGQQALLSAHNTVILVVTAHLLLTFIKNQEVVDQIQEPSLVEHSKESAVQFVGDRRTDLFNMNIHLMAFFGILCKPVLLPFQIILLRSFDGTIAQAFAVVTGHAELHGGEEGRNKHLPLVGQVLTDAVGDRHRTFLQFDNRHRDAVQINDQIRALFIVRNYGDLFSNVEEVFAGSFPVNEIYRSLVFVGILFDLGTVFQKPIDFPVGCVQTILQIGGGFDQFLHRPDGNGLGIAMFGQPRNQLLFIDIAVFSVFQITDVVIS